MHKFVGILDNPRKTLPKGGHIPIWFMREYPPRNESLWSKISRKRFVEVQLQRTGAEPFLCVLLDFGSVLSTHLPVNYSRRPKDGGSAHSKCDRLK